MQTCFEQVQLFAFQFFRKLLHIEHHKGWEFLGLPKKEYPGLALRALNSLPHGRGLGSSASAIIGGLVLSRSLVVGGADRMSDNDVLTLATEMEGHPDNVAAALFGGAVLA